MKHLFRILALCVSLMNASAVDPVNKIPTLHTDQEIVVIAKRHLGRELVITGTLDELSKKNAMSIGWNGFSNELVELRKKIGLNPTQEVLIEGSGTNHFYFDRLQVSPSYDLVMTFMAEKKRKPDGARAFFLILREAFFIPHKEEKYASIMVDSRKWGKVLFGKANPEENKKE